MAALVDLPPTPQSFGSTTESSSLTSKATAVRSDSGTAFIPADLITHGLLTAEMVPDRISIRLRSITCNRLHNKTQVRFKLQGTRQETKVAKSWADHTTTSFEFPITFHTLTFDSIKIDLFDVKTHFGTPLARQAIGRAYFNLKDLTKKIADHHRQQREAGVFDGNCDAKDYQPLYTLVLDLPVYKRGSYSKFGSRQGDELGHSHSIFTRKQSVSSTASTLPTTAPATPTATTAVAPSMSHSVTSFQPPPHPPPPPPRTLSGSTTVTAASATTTSSSATTRTRPKRSDSFAQLAKNGIEVGMVTIQIKIHYQHFENQLYPLSPVQSNGDVVSGMNDTITTITPRTPYIQEPSLPTIMSSPPTVSPPGPKSADYFSSASGSPIVNNPKSPESSSSNSSAVSEALSGSGGSGGTLSAPSKSRHHRLSRQKFDDDEDLNKGHRLHHHVKGEKLSKADREREEDLMAEIMANGNIAKKQQVLEKRRSMHMAENGEHRVSGDQGSAATTTGIKSQHNQHPSFSSTLDPATQLVTEAELPNVDPLVSTGVNAEEKDGKEKSKSKAKHALRFNFFSDQTRSAFKDIQSLYSSFFGSGWNLSRQEFWTGIQAVENYYEQHPTPTTNKAFSDLETLGRARHFIRLAIASYGSLPWVYFGYSIKVLPLNMVRLHSDRKNVMDYFKLKKEDMIIWHFDKRTALVPSYYIVRDPKTNSLCIIIRGTFSITDAMTDLVCEYYPYKGGLVHKGIMDNARFILERSGKDIEAAIQRFNLRTIYCIGHSLGAGSAALLCPLLQDHFASYKTPPSPAGAFKQEGNQPLEIKAYLFAPPPVCTPNLAMEWEKTQIAFVNENDVVCRLSYGNALDLKELIKIGAIESRNPAYKGLDPEIKKQKVVDVVAEAREKLKTVNDVPRLVISGKVTYLHKVYQSTPVVRNLSKKGTKFGTTDATSSSMSSSSTSSSLATSPTSAEFVSHSLNVSPQSTNLGVLETNGSIGRKRGKSVSAAGTTGNENGSADLLSRSFSALSQAFSFKKHSHRHHGSKTSTAAESGTSSSISATSTSSSISPTTSNFAELSENPLPPLPEQSIASSASSISELTEDSDGHQHHAHGDVNPWIPGMAPLVESPLNAPTALPVRGQDEAEDDEELSAAERHLGEPIAFTGSSGARALATNCVLKDSLASANNSNDDKTTAEGDEDVDDDGASLDEATLQGLLKKATESNAIFHSPDPSGAAISPTSTTSTTVPFQASSSIPTTPTSPTPILTPALSMPNAQTKAKHDHSKQKEIRIEFSDRENFMQIPLQGNWLWHHFPQQYDSRIERALAWATAEAEKEYQRVAEANMNKAKEKASQREAEEYAKRVENLRNEYRAQRERNAEQVQRQQQQQQQHSM